MNRLSFVRSLLPLSALALVVSVAGAQVPSVTKPIDATRRAVAATDAHTQAMQAPEGQLSARPVAPPHAAAAASSKSGSQKPATSVPAASTVPAGKTGAKGAAMSAAPNAASANSNAKPGIASTPATGKTMTSAAAEPNPAKSAANAPANAPASAAASAAASAPKGAVEKKNEIAFTRETFTYGTDGRRDPFVSLMSNGDLRPMVSDLRLVTVLYDVTGHSVAILRDVTTKEQYRVKVGQTIGRMRVSAIQPKSITFSIEEFGYGRQEVLALNDSTRARAK